MEKTINIGKSWEFGIYWRKDWKFVGFIEDAGFGKYWGLTLKKWDKWGKKDF